MDVVQSFPVTVENVSHQENFKNPMHALKSNTGLNDGLNVEDESKTPVGHRKCIFWQTSINDQRPKLRVYINGIFIEGLLDTSVNVSIITSESWHLN